MTISLASVIAATIIPAIENMTPDELNSIAGGSEHTSGKDRIVVYWDRPTQSVRVCYNGRALAIEAKSIFRRKFDNAVARDGFPYDWFRVKLDGLTGDLDGRRADRNTETLSIFDECFALALDNAARNADDPRDRAVAEAYAYATDETVRAKQAEDKRLLLSAICDDHAAREKAAGERIRLANEDGIIRFSSGRTMDPPCGIIGLSHEMEVGEGSDNSPNIAADWNAGDAGEDYYAEYLRPEDLAELADIMIDRWQRFKASVEGKE
jgi:hypothetical protein